MLRGPWGIDGSWIEPGMLAAAKDEEMRYMMKHGFYVVVNEEECRLHQCPPLTLKWVDQLKGDGCRSRLVVRKIKAAKKCEDKLSADEVSNVCRSPSQSEFDPIVLIESDS